MAFPEGGDFRARFNSGYGDLFSFSTAIRTDSSPSRQNVRFLPGEFEQICSQFPLAQSLESVRQEWGGLGKILPFEELTLDAHNHGISLIRQGYRLDARVPYLSANMRAKKQADPALVLNMDDGRIRTEIVAVPGLVGQNLLISDSGFLPHRRFYDLEKLFQENGLKSGIGMLVNNGSSFDTRLVSVRIPLGIKQGEETRGSKALYEEALERIKQGRVMSKTTPPEIIVRTIGLAEELGIDTQSQAKDGVIVLSVGELEERFQIPWIT